jgi:heavy metal sensor kinase
VTFAFFYYFITTVIRNQTDQDLQKQAGVFSSIMAVNGLEAVERVAVREAQASGEKKFFFRLLYATGVAFASSNMAYWENIGINRGMINRLVRNDRPVYDTVTIPERQLRIRVLYEMLGSGIILQLGQTMENQARFIQLFKKLFFITMSVLVLLAALIGWFLAQHAVAGVRAVTLTARHIAAGTLDERVPTKGRGDEIDQLATTFNHMLDRIQQLVISMREMSDNIAHDLRSPVTRIRGNAEIALTTGKSMSSLEDMAAGTIEECDRLLDMINTMLVISKTEAGVGRLEIVTLDFAALVKDACELFQPAAEDKGVTLSWAADEPCWVKGDMRMLQRMVANLIDNAIKYTPPSGSVTIRLEKSLKGVVCLTIRDTGIGISAQDLPHIFERFYRSDPSRSPGQPDTGVGLGLSLGRTIARAHGGEILVASTPDTGSTFTVQIPAS